MKLYHYAPKENTVLQNGILSISKIDRDLKPYFHRAGSENKDDILKWLESTFQGRSKAISCLTEPIRWEGNDPILKKIVAGTELFSFRLEDLINDGLVEAIWCKNGSDANGCHEIFYSINVNDIDLSPLAWDKVDSSKGLLYAVIKHYMIVLKDGYIPPKYIIKEK